MADLKVKLIFSGGLGQSSPVPDCFGDLTNLATRWANQINPCTGAPWPDGRLAETVQALRTEARSMRQYAFIGPMRQNKGEQEDRRATPSAIPARGGAAFVGRRWFPQGALLGPSVAGAAAVARLGAPVPLGEESTVGRLFIPEAAFIGRDTFVTVWVACIATKGRDASPALSFTVGLLDYGGTDFSQDGGGFNGGPFTDALFGLRPEPEKLPGPWQETPFDQWFSDSATGDPATVVVGPDPIIDPYPDAWPDALGVAFIRTAGDDPKTDLVLPDGWVIVKSFGDVLGLMGTFAAGIVPGGTSDANGTVSFSAPHGCSVTVSMFRHANIERVRKITVATNPNPYVKTGTVTAVGPHGDFDDFGLVQMSPTAFVDPINAEAQRFSAVIPVTATLGAPYGGDTSAGVFAVLDVIDSAHISSLDTTATGFIEAGPAINGSDSRKVHLRNIGQNKDGSLQIAEFEALINSGAGYHLYCGAVSPLTPTAPPGQPQIINGGLAYVETFSNGTVTSKGDDIDGYHAIDGVVHDPGTGIFPISQYLVINWTATGDASGLNTITTVNSVSAVPSYQALRGGLDFNEVNPPPDPDLDTLTTTGTSEVFLGVSPNEAVNFDYVGVVAKLSIPRQ